MADIKRYTPDMGPWFEEDLEGEWVRHSDHEAVIQAAVAKERRRTEKAERTIRADERQRVWADLMRRFSERDRRRIASNFAHDYMVISITMEAKFRADIVETLAASVPRDEAIAQIESEKSARIAALRGAAHD